MSSLGHDSAASDIDLFGYASLWYEFTDLNDMNYEVFPVVSGDPGEFHKDELYTYEESDINIGTDTHVPGFEDPNSYSDMRHLDSAVDVKQNANKNSKRRKSDDGGGSVLAMAHTTTESSGTTEFLAAVGGGGGAGSASDSTSVASSSESVLSSAAGRPIRSTRIKQRLLLEGSSAPHARAANEASHGPGGLKKASSSAEVVAPRNNKRKIVNAANADIIAEVTKFPVQLVETMNSGDANKINDFIEQFLTPNCKISTKAFPHTLEGHAVAKGFFNGVLSTHPDMIMCLTDVHRNQDQSIIFRGTFEGTFVGSYNKNDLECSADHLSAAKNSLSFVELIMEGGKGDPDFHLPASEIARLEKLDKEARTQHVHVISFSKWICKILRTRVPSTVNGSRKGKTYKVSKLSFDWKTIDIRASQKSD